MKMEYMKSLDGDKLEQGRGNLHPRWLFDWSRSNKYENLRAQQWTKRRRNTPQLLGQ